MSGISMLPAAYNMHTSRHARAHDQVLVQKTLGSYAVGPPSLPTRDERSFQRVGELSNVVQVATGSLAIPEILSLLVLSLSPKFSTLSCSV